MSEVIRVYASDRHDLATMERLVALDALPEDWRRYFDKKLTEKSAVSTVDEWTSESTTGRSSPTLQR